MATPPKLPTRGTLRTPTLRGQRERLSTLPERQSPAYSDRTVGNADEHGLEADAVVGVWYDVVSTWLSRVKATYAPVRGGPPTQPTDDPKQRTIYLQIEFLSGATVEYTRPQPYSVFDDLINSSSKGQYVHHASSGLYHQPYTLLSPGFRKPTKEQIRLRAPKANRAGGLRLIGRRKPPPLPRSVAIG